MTAAEIPSHSSAAIRRLLASLTTLVQGPLGPVEENSIDTVAESVAGTLLSHCTNWAEPATMCSPPFGKIGMMFSPGFSGACRYTRSLLSPLPMLGCLLGNDPGMQWPTSHKLFMTPNAAIAPPDTPPGRVFFLRILFESMSKRPKSSTKVHLCTPVGHF